MGARGRLKLANPLTSVADAAAGTAASRVSAVAPVKPAAVLDDDALSVLWDTVVPTLADAGLLSPSDGPAVEMCIRHFAAARVASDQLLAEGPTEDDRKNDRRMKNPAEVVFRSESMAFLDYAKQLGMTFASRARVTVAGEGSADGNPFGAALG